MAFTDAAKQNGFDKEIKELISSLTSCASSIPKNGGDSTQHNTQDYDGLRMITLAGTNVGANMHGEMDEKPNGPQGIELGGTEELTTYANNNFQAINNSIILGGSYNTKDPGVHLDVSEYMDHNAHHLEHDKKEKKSEREGSKSDHQNESSSD
ncbi:uncharacterized protein LOC111366511 [Olea europaea var. sylvestris]|uniref:Uncharacterized protein n=1 Tax=Olea europaea subsp. europaea TaxID=158383 RepID=A0A8S0UH06_OLEEU|nr:uncharacterized protein LOC111366511 [Olea europaea var. sylvestris]CAA3017464.1 Hypothetical predicted protein [Olea europaea subsp. europaea]